MSYFFVLDTPTVLAVGFLLTTCKFEFLSIFLQKKTVIFFIKPKLKSREESLLKKIIIAEKPSLGQRVAGAIDEVFTNKDGYKESTSYIVTWAFGHLFGLYDLEEYDPNYNPEEKHTWCLDPLPFCPEKFQYELSAKKENGRKVEDQGIKKQFNLIKALLNRPDVDEIIHCGDSDREGEIIVRNVLAFAKNTKPVKRLWLPDQENETIREQLMIMKDDSEYDDLANEGYARTYIDWLFGINVTRYVSVKAGTILREGRVITAIVAEIYKRDQAIKNFVPQKYYVACSEEKTKDEVIILESKRRFTGDQYSEISELCDSYNKSTFKVIEKSTKRKEIWLNTLYSLETLQGAASKTFNYAPDVTLSVLQSLYEGGYVSYPRTNTEYLSVQEKSSVQKVLSTITDAPVAFRESSIFNDKYIESHSALTPTIKKPQNLSEQQTNIYNLIRNRFIAVFYAEPYIVDSSNIVISNGIEDFKLSGNVIIQKGWIHYDTKKHKNKILPNLNENDVVNVNFEPKEKETAPPKHFNVESIISFMKNPYTKEETENEEDDYKAILSGTQLGASSTRAQILLNAVNNGYITLKNKTYYITDKGEQMIKILEQLHINMDKNMSAQMGAVLKKVYHGELTVQESIQYAMQELNKIFEHKDIQVSSLANADKVVLGKCPVCGKNVIETPKAYSCENRECKVAFWKENKFLESMGKKFTAGMVKSLLKDNKCLLKGLKSKKGTTFDAFLEANYNEGRVNLNLTFNTAESLGVCPVCKKNVIETPKAYSCEDKNCNFVLWKSNKFFDTIGFSLNKTKVKELLKTGRMTAKNLKSKSGKTYDAYLIPYMNGKYINFKIGFPSKN